MKIQFRSRLPLIGGGFLGLASAIALSLGVAVAAPAGPVPENQVVLVIVCTTSPTAGQTLQCSPATAQPSSTPNALTTATTFTTATTRLNTLPTNTSTSVAGTQSDGVDSITDPRVDTYARRQAIRDQYRGRINETTFNDELADGVSLNDALADPMAEVNLQTPQSR